ncbi:MAG: aminomethyltransferase family protein [Woeseiaceae bacterium]|jgi:aminomethyltransferase|nr:aminomethyl transferase family protein [Woeseiaceae bacterium]MDG1015915.1 aminomethyltransferase family protein [Woeseiaceae bacterium]MDG1864890.1 aminomethyltransferase family protein [Woeseiaceae bacterium]
MKNDTKFADERLKLSPFHKRQAALNIRDSWSVWNGYKFANYYYDAEYEYFCVRNTCGTYDICPMQKYLIEGNDAEAMLNRMVTRDITKLRQNRVTYVCWCTNEGRMIDDGTIFKLGSNKFMLTCGSPSLAWLRKASFGFDAVKITDITDTLAALSFQGPTTYSVLKALGLKGIEDLKPFQIGYYDFSGTKLMISRTGFTGDLGYELWVENEYALELWDALYDKGENFGIQPYGEEATNMARLEAGFIMPYMEFNEALKTVHYQHDQTPFELSLGWLVDFNKPLFNGRKALLLDKKNGPKYTLTKLDIEGNKPAEGSYIYGDKKCSLEIGYVTSAMWSPAVKANIAMAMIKTEYLQGEIWAEIYYEKELRQYDKVARCTIKEKPFWAPSRARMTPPENY